MIKKKHFSFIPVFNRHGALAGASGPIDESNLGSTALEARGEKATYGPSAQYVPFRNHMNPFLTSPGARGRVLNLVGKLGTKAH